MAGLEVVTNTLEHIKMDSPTSNISGCTLRSNTSFSNHSRTSSGFHSQGVMEHTCLEAENHHGSLETINTIFHEFDCAERYPRLVEVDRVPWTDNEVELVLQSNLKAKKQSRNISYSAVQRLSYLLQRPLIRIVREVKRLSQAYKKCAKHDIFTAIKSVLSYNIGDKCLGAATKALSSYQMSAGLFKQCKTRRAGLKFSVGQFYRWMVDVSVAPRIDDHAAVCLAACMECLTVLIVERACAYYKGQECCEVTMEMLELGVSEDAESWGLLQPFEHLVCGRNASGLVIFPSTNGVSKSSTVNGHTEWEHDATHNATPELNKTLEQSMMVTCVGSIIELGELVGRAMHYLQNIQKLSHNYHNHSDTTWTTGALHSLFHFMKCNQLESQDEHGNVQPPHQQGLQLTPERSYVVLPPLLEWMRVATAHCLHRFGSGVDANDVLQAARVLLPGMDCPVRPLTYRETLSYVRSLDAEKTASKFRQDLGFQMLECGRPDLIPHAAQLLGPDGLNTISEQGLTPLMFACMQGDEALVQQLLENGAKVDVVVPNNSQKHSSIHPTIRSWTALSFAVAHSHIRIAQILLENGASTEGSVEIHGDNYTQSPLQLASTAGNLDIVCLLLSRGADPYLTTVQNNCFTNKGHGNSFALAAAHGHRGVLRKLLEQPHSRRSSDILSLEEMLAEGVDAEPRRRERRPSKTTKSKLSAQLQEAMYHSCEHGFIEIVMELRSLGIPWTLHCWVETLSTNRQLHRRGNLQCLLRDFSSIKLEEDWDDFVNDGLPLLFEIFRYSRDELLSRQLATIFTSLYGQGSIPDILVPTIKTFARIDPQFVNNPEMSDVTFMVEGKPFYAHKIVLVTASKRFKALLAEAKCVETGKSPVIEISDIKYHIFKIVMQFLYNGTAEHIASKDILELMAAANFFAVDGLILNCSRLCSQKLSVETAITIYRHARLYNAPALIEYCHAFFLANFTNLLTENEAFRKLLRGNRPHPHDTLSMLQEMLARRVTVSFTESKV